jgi:hypothetical protein
MRLMQTPGLRQIFPDAMLRPDYMTTTADRANAVLTLPVTEVTEIAALIKGTDASVRELAVT